MAIAKPPPVCTVSSHTKTVHHHNNPAQKPNPHHHNNSMSGHQQYHPHQESNIFSSFTNGFDRSAAMAQQDQIRSDIEHNAAAQDPALHPVYETAGMLSEMFNFVHGPGPAASPEILDYRRAVGGLGPDWYGGNSSRQVGRDSIEDHHPHHQRQQQSDHHHQIPSINAESAAAMQLFLTNPPPRSPSPPGPLESTSGSTLHMLLPNPTNIHAPGSAYYWSTVGPGGAHINNPGELGGMVEGQGLSLSLSSSLQHLEAAKQAEQLRNMGGGDSHNIMFFKNLQQQQEQQQQQQQPIMHNLQGFGSSPGQQQVHIGFGSTSTSSLSIGVVNTLRNSKYAKAAQELLEEFCSVGRGHLKKSKSARQNSVNPNEGGVGAGSSAQLSAGDRIEHQRRKVKLLSMLDEVDRRYNHYCEQTQMVVNSYEVVMGYGAAIPYTALAQKAMSRHFRCLKEAIQTELRKSCEVLGEKDPTASTGLSKGETPRLKMLEQSLRQQRAFHQMGMMEQEAWRPQRGLPDRSVNILRAWLFEHFLHPYPNDADKHLLARQTGLSRNQVSNWFINARVRLWKPMVEEMYQQEAKEVELDDDVEERDRNQTSSSTSNTNNNNSFPQNPMPCSSASASTTMLTEAAAKRTAETMTPSAPPTDIDPSQALLAINSHHHQPPLYHHQATSLTPSQAFLHGNNIDNTCHFGVTAAPPPPDNNVGPTTMIRFGAASGDVSLTLGLRHAGNAPEKSAAFSVRDFGSC